MKTEANHMFTNAIKYRLNRGLFWNRCCNNVRNPKQIEAIRYTTEIINEIVEILKMNNFNVKPYTIDVADYHSYLKAANYETFSYYKNGKGKNFPEKSLEHYLAFKFLNLKADDVYIDIGNFESPTLDIYHNLVDCITYKQDLQFPEGVHGNTIGGDAGNLPLPNGFASKMGLHCAFEHFENDSDIRFIREAGRVLRPGGKVCIVPFYLFNQYAIQTNPAHALIDIEPDAVAYCAKNYHNRHGRFYDVPHIISRIRNNLGPLKLTIFVMQNEKEVDPSCYVKFIGLFEKMSECD